MEEFLKSLLSAVGGAVGVAVIFLGLFKNVVQKWIESTIDKVADKKLAKYSNSLTRKTMAYDLLLKKEFVFYESVSSLLNKFSENIQKFILDIGANPCMKYIPSYDNALKSQVQVIQIATDFERIRVMYDNYIPDDISKACVPVVGVMMSCIEMYGDSLEQTGKGDELTLETKEEIFLSNKVFHDKSKELNLLIKQRLLELTEED